MASIQKTKSGWRYRVSYKENGKYKTKTRGGFRTKKEAELAAAELEKQLHQGIDVNAGEQLFPLYMRNWYEIFRKGRKSIENDLDIDRVVRFVEEKFEGIPIKNITRQMYQKVLNELGENRSTATVKKYHTYMRLCLREALSDGVIYRDPTIGVVVTGKVPAKDESVKFLNYEDASKLLSAALNGLQPRYISRYMIIFALATGARFSEVAGLTWDCVNFRDKTITINKTWDHKFGKGFKNTKNYASKRTITIDDTTIKILKDLKHKQNETALSTGLRNHLDLVFVNSTFNTISSNAVNKTLKALCEKAGIKDSITFHGLRHTHASMLLYKGVNIKYISRRLGHADVSMTLRTYSHIMDEMEQLENRTVDNIMEELYKVK